MFAPNSYTRISYWAIKKFHSHIQTYEGKQEEEVGEKWNDCEEVLRLLNGSWLIIAFGFFTFQLCMSVRVLLLLLLLLSWGLRCCMLLFLVVWCCKVIIVVVWCQSMLVLVRTFFSVLFLCKAEWHKNVRGSHVHSVCRLFFSFKKYYFVGLFCIVSCAKQNGLF